MILAGDVGGTKVNLASYELEGGRLIQRTMQSYASNSFRSLIDTLREFRKEPGMRIDAAAFGIAGPVVDGRSKLTNLGWDVDAAAVADFLGLRHVHLMNDLAATAYGVLTLQDSQLVALNVGRRQKHGTIAVIAAGTGLGEGALVWNGNRYLAVPTEGGHTDFGPRSPFEIELLTHLRSKFGRVSYERIVSGPGIMNVYEFVRQRSEVSEPLWLQERLRSGDPSAVVSTVGLEGSDPVCVQVLDTVASIYAAEAGNLALKFLATGGVYIAGGIAPKILPRLQQPDVLESFLAKGRYRSILSSMPLAVVLNPHTALEGAALVAAFPPS